MVPWKSPPRAPKNWPPVTEADKEAARDIIARWKVAGEAMQRERDEKIRNADTVRSMEILGGMYLHSVQNYPPKPTSGLVEQQRWFMKLRDE